MNEPDKFFIVGVGRSGTTLLQSLLDAHPKITVLPETQYVLRFLIPYADATLDQAKNLLGDDEHFARLSMPLDALFEPFDRGGRPFSMGALLLRCMDYGAEQQGVGLVGEKAPKNVEFLPILKRLSPDAKVVHIIRDPRDVYLSRQKAGWSAGRSDYSQFLAYRAQIAIGRDDGPRLFGDRYTEVFYEQLIGDGEDTLGKLARFLGVDFDPAMLQSHKSSSHLVAQDEAAWKQNIGKPLLTGNANKWKQQMSPAQTQKVEAACWPVFRQGLYRPACGGATRRPAGVRNRVSNATMAAASFVYNARVRRRNQRVIRLLDHAESRQP